MHEAPRLNCRVWLTTLPSKEFPVSLLQKAVKVACDKPKGIAQSMMHSFKEIEGLFDEPGLQLEARKKLLFGLCLLHSVITERARFGTLAWNLPYNFSQADLLVAARQIVELLKDSEEVSWAAVDHLVVEANYGAQINDAMDSRVLRAMVADFVSSEILADNYKFCGLKEYELPKGMKTKEDYAMLIRDFPKNDNPELFGLNEAEAIQYSLDDAIETRSMLSQLISGSSKTAHQLQENLPTKVKDMIKELPGDLSKSECMKKYPIQHAECLNSILQQEVCRYESLLNVVRSSLLSLHSALKGEVVLSKDLDEIAQSISHNIVPSLWYTHAYPSLKPLSSWMKDLEERMGFLEYWVKEGHPSKFKLSVFFNPESFLAALKQNYARKNGMNFSDVFFEYEVGAEKKSKGKLIEGLYMEGARWDRREHCLAELTSDTIPEEMPAILFTPTTTKAKPAVLLLSRHRATSVRCTSFQRAVGASLHCAASYARLAFCFPRAQARSTGCSVE
eukprot:TRINITY_DN11830_c0_g1_i3.p1 TRINITY_DN11830_c0_g1~~TRINITY_DN11830_c0_g1_i3.p1  ORF type:complete len:505 (-),score=94.23 TRINITY_DN11830_c0_g1_i3:62-1576(-)